MSGYSPMLELGNEPLTPREKVALKPCPMCGMTDSTDNATQESGLHIQSFRSPAGGDACRVQCTCGVSGPSSREDWQAAERWNRRTALASGSGDHAELERLADRNVELSVLAYKWMEAHDALKSGQTYDYPSPADVPTLLAENAALRAERDEWRDTAFKARSSNTRAERKLAEAEETSTRWAIRFAELRKAAGIGVKPMLSDVPGELRKMRSLIDRAAELMRQCTDPERFEGVSTLNVYANMRAWLSDLSKEAERG